MNNLTLEQIHEKAITFRNLHQRAGIFVIPNPWDAGSAKILESLGFEALATTSGGMAFSAGKPDGHASITRAQVLDHGRSINAATSLPVSADLENGYGDDPEACAETIILASKAGLAGGSIEDATNNPADPIYSFELSVERVKAAVLVARSLPVPFTITARAENFIKGRPNLEDTVRRLEAYADAGADVLFAPGLKTLDEVKTVVKAVAPRPVNVIMGIPGADITLEQLGEIGVRRVSLGSALMRTAYGELFKAVQEVKEKGTFTFGHQTQTYLSFNKLFEEY